MTTTTYPVQHSGEAGVTTLFLEAVLDASGDVSSYVRQKGIATLATAATGTYTLTLRDTWNKFLGCRILFKKATDIAVRYQISAEDVDGAKTITILFRNLSSPSGAANPVSCSIYVEVKVSNVDD